MGQALGRRKWGIAVFLVLALFAGGVAVLLFVFAQPIAKYVVSNRARAQGLEVETDYVVVDLSGLTLERFRARPVGISGVSVAASKVKVALGWLSVQRIDVHGAALRVEGPIMQVASETQAWLKARASDAQMVHLHDLQVDWAGAAKQTPWLVLRGGSAEPIASGTTIYAADLRVQGIALGPVWLTRSSDRASVQMGLGKSQPSAALLRFDIQGTAAPLAATLSLQPVAVSSLQPIVAAAGPMANIVVDGTATFTAAPVPNAGDVDVRATMNLRGYVPPHPKELDGIIYGTTTSLGLRARVSEGRDEIPIAELSLESGAFKLSGSGTMKREQQRGRIHANLAGQIPCSALARSAATAQLGRTVGGLLGDLAKVAVTGAIAINATVDIDTADLSAMAINPVVGGGCGLKF